MFACTTPKYAKLYARWLEKPGTLLDWAALQPDDRVLDLCGGTGVVAETALERGCRDVTLLDLNPRCTDSRVAQKRGHAEEAAYLFDGDSFDLVVCRQALGYLDLHDTANAVKHILTPGGRFVFNTFKRPRWALKSYRFAGRHYLEASAYVGRHVIHMQASPQIGADLTYFRWHKHEDILNAVRPYFIVETAETARSIRYCLSHKESIL